MSGNRWAQGEAMNIISRRRGRGYETAAACTGGGYIIKGIFFFKCREENIQPARSLRYSLAQSLSWGRAQKELEEHCCWER